MRKRVPILFMIVAIAIVGAIAWWMSAPKEPVYQGKRLTTWLQAYNVTNVTSANRDLVVERMKRTDEVVRNIGTNAIPTLLRLLRAKDSALKLKLIHLAQKQHWVTIRPVPARDWNGMAPRAFAQLRHDADTALPALVDIYEQNISPESRYCALEIIGHLGLPAKRIVPTLLAQASDPNQWIRLEAVSVLGEIHCEPEQVVPALMKALHDPDVSIRITAAIGLGAFGPAARQAVPALVDSLKDENRGVRARAAKSLRAIDPEAAAKAGVK
ncbi:MAG: lyase domain protein repeat-containing protein [Pedosphaera sp.]|nr:lyase domain protein repeat-containing protein [Pedosphaera sp.]